MQEETITVIPADNNSGEDTAASIAADQTQETAAKQTETADEATTESAVTATAQQESESAVYTPVYKGKTYTVRADDRQEITTLLQLGMKQREFLPTYERLARLAADMGGQSVTAFINELCDRQEDVLRERAVAAYGEEAGKRFYELERAERERQYRYTAEEQHTKTQQQREEMLAQQFTELQTYYPAYTDFRDVPQEIIKTALEKEISLLDAQNRAVLADQKYREQQQVAEATAAAQTTGSLSYGGKEIVSPMDAFLTGLHTRT